MQAQTFISSASAVRVTPRLAVALSAGAAGLALVGAGTVLPWVVLFRGLQPQDGFILDGGKLAGLAIASMVGLLVAARFGGGRVFRLGAIAANLVVLADSLLITSRIAAYVADPGPAGPLTQPSTGPGSIVMAVGAALLIVAAVVAPLRAGRIQPRIAPLVALAAALFVAGWIHLLLAPEHLEESPILGTGFLLAGLAQVALAGIVLARPREWTAYVIVALNAGLIAIYVNAVLVGLPFGANDHRAAGLVLGAGEPVDVFGALTTVAQVLGVVLALGQLGRSPTSANQSLGPRTPPMPRGMQLPSFRRREDQPEPAVDSDAVAARLHRIMERPAAGLPDRAPTTEASPPPDQARST